MSKLIKHWESHNYIAGTYVPGKTNVLTIPGRKKIIQCRQVHGNRVIEVKNNQVITRPDCDGMVTKESNVSLVIQTADCIPIFLLEEDRNIVGVVHAGWRGTLAHIAVNALKLMTRMGADLDKIKIHLGPHINSCCYKVSMDLAAKFSEAFGKDTVLLKSNNYYLDLSLATTVQLAQYGIRNANITVSPECTSCDNSLISYRRSKLTNTKCGSMYSYIQSIRI